MAVLRPGPEMKDSGVEWIGSIPCNWNVSPLYSALMEINQKNSPIYTTNILSLTNTDGVIPYSERGNQGNKSKEDFEEYKVVYPNTIVANSMNILIGSVGLSAYEGCVSPVYYVYAAKPNYDIRYLNYLFQMELFQKCLRQFANGIMEIRLRVSSHDIMHQKVMMPSYQEQQSIADYLDDRCSKIDEIIAEATASIEEYTLYKQAIIAEVTTKGLNKNAAMKDTSYVWMGSIPVHWELKPFRYILNERNEKNNPVKSEERLSLSIDKGVTLYAEKTTNLDRFKEDFTAYKLAYEGDLVMNCMNMIVGASGVSKYFGCVSPVYYTYYDNEPDHITAKYCEYLFRSRMLMRVLHSLGRGILSFDKGEDRVNTCRLKISRNDLRSLVLPVPPLNEQREIVDYLMNYDRRIDALISEKQSLIDDLQAYKKSLIYEVVTGKRRVV